MLEKQTYIRTDYSRDITDEDNVDFEFDYVTPILSKSWIGFYYQFKIIFMKNFTEKSYLLQSYLYKQHSI